MCASPGMPSASSTPLPAGQPSAAHRTCEHGQQPVTGTAHRTQLTDLLGGCPSIILQQAPATLIAFGFCTWRLRSQTFGRGSHPRTPPPAAQWAWRRRPRSSPCGPALSMTQVGILFTLPPDLTVATCHPHRCQPAASDCKASKGQAKICCRVYAVLVEHRVW